jgi:hypothetical protein
MNKHINLRASYLAGGEQLPEDDERILVMPLSSEERADIRKRCLDAARNLKREAELAWQAGGPKLSTEQRMSIARDIDQAEQMLASVEALERLEARHRA